MAVPAHDETGETKLCGVSQRKIYLQNNEFAWLENEDTGRHQSEGNDKHDGGGNDEAAK